MAVILIGAGSIYEITNKKLLNDNQISSVNSTTNVVYEEYQTEWGDKTITMFAPKEGAPSQSININDLIEQVSDPDGRIENLIPETVDLEEGEAIINALIRFDFNNLNTTIKGEKLQVVISYDKYTYNYRDGTWINKPDSERVEELITEIDSTINSTSITLPIPKVHYTAPYRNEADGRVDTEGYFKANITCKLVGVSYVSNPVTNSESKNGFDLEYNELMQNKDYINQYITRITTGWIKGKKTISLRVKYSKYSDTENNLVYNGTNGDIIKVGDLVRPMKTVNGVEIPMFNRNGLPIDFKVISSEFTYNGYPYVEIDLIEN